MNVFSFSVTHVKGSWLIKTEVLLISFVICDTRHVKRRPFVCQVPAATFTSQEHEFWRFLFEVDVYNSTVKSRSALLLVTVARGVYERPGCSTGPSGSCTDALWETLNTLFLLTTPTCASAARCSSRYLCIFWIKSEKSCSGCFRNRGVSSGCCKHVAHVCHTFNRIRQWCCSSHPLL